MSLALCAQLSFESFIFASVAAGCTLLYYYLAEPWGSFNANVSWTFVTFSVVFPLTTSINQGGLG